jgi:hypothetical protein
MQIKLFYTDLLEEKRFAPITNARALFRETPYLKIYIKPAILLLFFSYCIAVHSCIKQSQFFNSGFF